MKNKIFITICLFLFANNTLFAQGWHEGEETYKWLSELPKKEKSRSILPISASLEYFTPNVIDQGQTGMCVSFALSTIHTIIYARNNNITDKETIDKYRSSPSFLYYLMKNSNDKDCKAGFYPTNTLLAMGFMTKYGIPYSSDVEDNQYHPFSNNMICEKYPYNNNDLINDIKKASNYRTIPSVSCGERKTIGRNEVTLVDHKAVKSELAAGNPCLLSAVFSRDFFSKEKENCTSNPEGKSDGVGHAMVIVGYDDAKQSYKIMNSYGNDWGCDGYTWIKYSELTVLDGYILSFNGSDSRKKAKTDDIVEFLEEIESLLDKDFSYRIQENSEELIENVNETEQLLEMCQEENREFFSNNDDLGKFCECYYPMILVEFMIDLQIGKETTDERINEIWAECYINVLLPSTQE